MRRLVFLGLVAFMSACVGGEASKAETKPTCLEGKVVYKGNSPFAQLHLQTKSVLYRLDFSAVKTPDLEGALAKRQNETLRLCGSVVSDSVPNSPILLLSATQALP